MPAVSDKQKRFMDAVAHNKAFAKRVGVPQSVGKEFSKTSKGLKFKEGGEMKESKKTIKKEVAFMKKKGAPKSMIRHEEAEMEGYKHGGKVKKMAMGGQADPRMVAMMEKRKKMARRRPPMGMMPPEAGMAPPMAPPGPAPTMKKGGRISSKGEHEVQKKSKRGAEMVKMAGGGALSPARGYAREFPSNSGPTRRFSAGGYTKAADGVAQRGKTKATQVKMAGGGKTKRYC